MRILLIEDDPGMAALMTTFLKPYSSIIVCCKELALAFAEAARGVFDVVLLDLKLPDSHERDDTLKSIPDLKGLQPNAAIIVVSGDPAPEMMRIKAVTFGADMYLDKLTMGNTAGRALYSAIATVIVGKPHDDKTATFDQHAEMLLKLANMEFGKSTAAKPEISDLAEAATDTAETLRDQVAAVAAAATDNPAGNLQEPLEPNPQPKTKP